MYVVAKSHKEYLNDEDFNARSDGPKVDKFQILSDGCPGIQEARDIIQEMSSQKFAQGVNRLVILQVVEEAVPPKVDITPTQL